MAIDVYEAFESRPTTRESGNFATTIKLILVGSDDDGEIELKLQDPGVLPLTYDNGVYELPLKAYRFNQIGHLLWEAEAEYGSIQTASDGSSFTFETGGGTAKITQSKETVNKYAASGTAPDMKGAIGVTDRSIEGCEIFVPVYKWTEKYTVDASVVDASYKATVFSLTGRTNNASFKGFSAGEVLFEGCQGSKDGYFGPWELTFKFSASPNVTGLAIGSITGIAKKGWEYLWVRYDETEDATAKALVRRPSAVYVERVYDSGDMALLGI